MKSYDDDGDDDDDDGDDDDEVPCMNNSLATYLFLFSPHHTLRMSAIPVAANIPHAPAPKRSNFI